MTRTKEYIIDPAKPNTKGPAGTKPYQSKTWVGHYYATKRITGGGWGCHNLEWKVASAVKKVTFTARKS